MRPVVAGRKEHWASEYYWEITTLTTSKDPGNLWKWRRIMENLLSSIFSNVCFTTFHPHLTM